MKFTLSPLGDDGTPDTSQAVEYDIDGTDYTVGEVKLIERTLDMPFVSILVGHREDGILTFRMALIWLLRRRTEPELAYSAMDDVRLTQLSYVEELEEGEPVEAPAEEPVPKDSASAEPSPVDPPTDPFEASD